MKDYKTPILVAVVVLGFFALGEYRKLKNGFAATQQSVAVLLDETKVAVRSFNDAIDSLRMEENAAIESNLNQATSNLDQITDEVDRLLLENRALSKRAIEAEQSLQLIQNSPKPKVKMHSGRACIPCQQWKQQQKPLWEAMGFQVEIEEESTTNKSWPWFEICDGDRCYEVIGPVTLENYARTKANKK